MFNPAYPEAHNNLATLLMEKGEFNQAASHYRQALIWNPDLPQARLNLASVLARLGEYAESNELFQDLLAQRPDDVDVRKQFAVGLAQQGRHSEALDMLEQVVADKPDSADAWTNLGTLYHLSRRFEDAVRCFDKALALRPMATEHLHRLIGESLLEQGDIDHSLQRFQHAAMLNPAAAMSNGNYAATLRATGRISEAVKSLQKSVDTFPDSIELRSNLIYTLHFDPNSTPDDRFAAIRAWGEQHGTIANEATPWTTGKERNRPLRVGLVSGDLREHAVSYFLAPLLEQYDRNDMAIFLYSTAVTPPDATSERFKRQAAHWRDIGGLANNVVADIVRRDAIDILIDLSVHTAGNRLQLFTLRPAPVQASWLGFFASTGVPAVQYRLTDAMMDPPGETEAWHTETLVRLPQALCYAPPATAPAVTASPMSINGYPTFGALHNYAKLNNKVFDAYAAILQRLPLARLIISNGASDGQEASERVWRQFALRDIDRERIDVVGNLSLEDYFQTLGRIDIQLDTFPYPGATTTMHSLWMGVPVVSIAGSSSYERAGASLLAQAGLGNLVAKDSQEYVDIAVALAMDGGQLGNLRNTLRDRLLNSPLLDGKAFARQFGQALRALWLEWIDEHEQPAKPKED
jgi:predicted O-linked N-acetylglucosamine transferase (SPINDLY family)